MTARARSIRRGHIHEHVNRAEVRAVRVVKAAGHDGGDAGRAFQPFAHAADVAVGVVIVLVGALVGAAGRGGFLEEHPALVVAVGHGVERVRAAHSQRREFVGQLLVAVVGVGGDGDGRAADLVRLADQPAERVVGVSVGDGGVRAGIAVLVEILDGLGDDAAIVRAGGVVGVIRLAAQAGRAGRREFAHQLVKLVIDEHGIVAARVNGIGHVAHGVVAVGGRERKAVRVGDFALEITFLRAAGIIIEVVQLPDGVGVGGRRVRGHPAKAIVGEVVAGGEAGRRDGEAVAIRVVGGEGGVAAGVGVLRRGDGAAAFGRAEAGLILVGRGAGGLVGGRAGRGQLGHGKTVAALAHGQRRARVAGVGHRHGITARPGDFRGERIEVVGVGGRERRRV